MEGDLTDAVVHLMQTGWAQTLIEEGVEAAIRKRRALGPSRDEVALAVLPVMVKLHSGVLAGSVSGGRVAADAFGLADAFLAYRKEHPEK